MAEWRAPTPETPETVVDMIGKMLGPDFVDALQQAFLTGNFGGVVHVLSTSSNPQIRAGKQAAFDTACQRGDMNLVHLAIVCGGVNTSTGPGQASILDRAVRDGKTDVVRALTESGMADVDRAVPGGTTALHEAAWSGDVACLQLLLAVEGVVVDQADDDGATPLRTACEKGREACARLLVAHGADPNRGDNDRCNALYACAQNGHDKFVY